MPSERRHMELNALLGALEFPVLSIDMGGSIVAATALRPSCWGAGR